MIKINAIEKRRSVDIGTIIYIFFAIFAPPFIPRVSVYAVGLLTVLLLLKENNGVIMYSTLRKSGMVQMYRVYLVFCLYLVVTWIVNAMFSTAIAYYSDVLHTLNQYLFLSALEFLSVYYVLIRSERIGFGYCGIIEGVAYAGGIQGICAILAYFFPTIRSLFLINQIEIFQNSWHLLRRGYGFSSMMLDMFGYGMGLIAGIVLLSDEIKGIKKIVLQILCLISAALNARTGLVIYAISVIVFIFKSDNIRKSIIKGILVFVPFFLCVIKI